MGVLQFPLVKYEFPVNLFFFSTEAILSFFIK